MGDASARDGRASGLVTEGDPVLEDEQAALRERIIERQGLSREDQVVIGIFARGLGEIGPVRAVYGLPGGRGPAAVRGRAGQDTLARSVWRPCIAAERVEASTPHAPTTVRSDYAPGASGPASQMPLEAARYCLFRVPPGHASTLVVPVRRRSLARRVATGPRGLRLRCRLLARTAPRA
jgi:hypothetical protein